MCLTSALNNQCLSSHNRYSFTTYGARNIFVKQLKTCTHSQGLTWARGQDGKKANITSFYIHTKNIHFWIGNLSG